jgi:hypothetical protein
MALTFFAGVVWTMAALAPVQAARPLDASGPPAPVQAAAAAASEADMSARTKLNAARAALAMQQYDAAGTSVLEVMRMPGLSPRWQAHAFAVGCDLGRRTDDSELVKVMCERVLSITGANETDRVSATDTLRTLRASHPDLFKR